MMDILIINVTILTTLINIYILLKIAQVLVSLREKKKLVKKMENEIQEVRNLVEEAIGTTKEDKEIEEFICPECNTVMKVDVIPGDTYYCPNKKCEVYKISEHINDLR